MAEKCRRVRAAHPHGWTTSTFVDRAECAGLGRFLPSAYYDPLLEAHPNVQGLLERLEAAADGSISIGDRVDRRLSDQVLSTAHLLVLEVLNLQVEHFLLNSLSSVTAQLLADYVEAWQEANVFTVKPGTPDPNP